MTDPVQQRLIERGDRLLLRLLSDSLREAARRVVIDPDGIEDAVLAELETACGAAGRTIVAFAVALERFPTDAVAADRPASCAPR